MSVMPTQTQTRAQYIKVAYAKLFKNDSDNPNAPALGNSKVEVLEDIKKGDFVSFSGWINADQQSGEKNISIMIQKKDGGGQPQAAAPTVTADDIPF
jgi:hypothetical protein